MTLMVGRPIGLILAGGRGVRLGRDKGTLVVDGQPLARRAAEALAPLCRGLLVSLRAGAANPLPGYPAVEDGPPAGRGPLAGILAGLEATEGADLLVLACDYPRVGTALLEALLLAARPADDVVFAVDSSGRDHPLVGLWRRRTAERIRSALADGRLRVGELLETLRAKRLGAADQALVNVNRPADLTGLL